MSQADQGGRLLRLAERLTDGEAIDWEHEEQTLPVERGPLRSLRDLHRIGHEGDRPRGLRQRAAGQASFSLVTGVHGEVEGSLGNASTGGRLNANPCP